MDTTAVDDTVRLNAVRKVYGKGANAVTALDGVSLVFSAAASPP